MIGIIGGGSWATAIAKILLEGGAPRLAWWVRSEEVCASLGSEGRNARHMPRLQLDSSRLCVSTRLEDVVGMCDTLFLAIPSAYLAQVFSTVPAEQLRGRHYVSLVKGAMPGRKQTVSMYLTEDIGVEPDSVCVVSGPSHAEEVAQGMPTFLTVASGSRRLADEVRQMLAVGYIHTAVSDDMAGVECCGLAKNIYAIAAGICQGLGYGDNMNAVLTTAALREMKVLMEHLLDCRMDNLATPCYLGDLMVTCWSRHSRNRALGEAVAHGLTVDEAFESIGTISEGYYSVCNVHGLAQQLGVELPIAEAVYRVLYESGNPRAEMEQLIDHVF